MNKSMQRVFTSVNLIATLLHLKQNVLVDGNEVFFGPDSIPRFKVYLTSNEEWDIYSIEKAGYIGIDYIFTNETHAKCVSVLKLLIDNFETDQEISIEEWMIDLKKYNFKEYHHHLFEEA